MRTAITASLAALAVVLAAGAAHADVFPVTGKFTYDDADEPGPAKVCGSRTMRFQGEQRFDTVGGASDLRNVSVVQTGLQVYQVVDEFFNAMIRGRVYYTLSVIDPDHVEIKLNSGGGTTLLRRCLT
jgi:hypothetical protein